MAKLNLDYYTGETDSVYSDGDIEAELLEYARLGLDNWYEDGRWPVTYHMSHLRHNILNWYPFEENCSILEIGSGCGAITGLLCEKAGTVVSIELTKRRAEINYERHKHNENLEIIVGDFHEIPKNRLFDYVIINGVLEYASYMIKGDNPYKQFLVSCSQFLNPNGRILLAIENRLGLKYFSGAREDHTGEYYSGINGYVNGEGVRTFSKEELIKLIYQSNLDPIKFYYPFPDYKFPSEILTDSTINNVFPSALDYALDMPRVRLFNESAVYKSFMELGLMGNLSNSFFVEISKIGTELDSRNFAYVKLNGNRNELFRIYTYYEEQKRLVYKKGLNAAAESHLSHMAKFSQTKYNNQCISNIDCTKENEGLSFPFIQGESFKAFLMALWRNNRKDEFNDKILSFRDSLYSIQSSTKKMPEKEFKQIFGEDDCECALRWKRDNNIDLIFDNIFLVDNEFKIIDYEWHLSCETPLEFVLWRTLKQFFDDNKQELELSEDWYLSIIGINVETEFCFKKWEEHFIEKYVGVKSLFKLQKDVISINIDEAAARTKKEMILESAVFFDLGDGYSDLLYEKTAANFCEQNRFEVFFSSELLKKAKQIRWDPLEGYSSIITIEKIETDGTIYSYNAINAEKFEDLSIFTFYTFDPQFHIKGDFSDASYLRILFSCTITDWTQGYRKREEDLIKLKSSFETLQFHFDQNAKQLQINELKAQEYEEVIRGFEESTKSLEKTIVELKTEINELIQSKRNQELEFQRLLDELEMALDANKLELNTQTLRLDEISRQIQEQRLKAIYNLLVYKKLNVGGV